LKKRRKKKGGFHQTWGSSIYGGKPRVKKKLTTTRQNGRWTCHGPRDGICREKKTIGNQTKESGGEEIKLCFGSACRGEKLLRRKLHPRC